MQAHYRQNCAQTLYLCVLRVHCRLRWLGYMNIVQIQAKKAKNKLIIVNIARNRRSCALYVRILRTDGLAT